MWDDNHLGFECLPLGEVRAWVMMDIMLVDRWNPLTNCPPVLGRNIKVKGVKVEILFIEYFVPESEWHIHPSHSYKVSHRAPRSSQDPIKVWSLTSGHSNQGSWMYWDLRRFYHQDNLNLISSESLLYSHWCYVSVAAIRELTSIPLE